MSNVTILRVESRRDREQFLRLPWSLYGDDPQWVPPLLQPLRDRLDQRQHPFFRHAEVQCFLALRDGEPVGRISAQYCQIAQQYHGEGTGHFGFFECVDDQATAVALLQSASGWLADRGATRMLGPFDLSINDEVGLLVEGFDRPPAIMMGHHRPYYQRLLTGAGMTKAMDLYAYYLDVNKPFPDRYQRIVRRALAHPKISVRQLKGRTFDSEMRQVLEVFREAWVDNWGYVPPTDAEVDHLIASIRQVINRGCVLLTEVSGESAGFMVVLPDVNEMIGDLDGRLLPFGWARLLWRLKFGRFRGVRVPLLGIRRKFQNTGMGAALSMIMIEQCREMFVPSGFTHCEMSWILENNAPMRAMLETIAADRDKTYRLFSKPI